MKLASGQRALYTWGGRMQLLHKLHFIDIKPGKSGQFSHVLIGIRTGLSGGTKSRKLRAWSKRTLMPSSDVP